MGYSIQPGRIWSVALCSMEKICVDLWDGCCNDRHWTPNGFSSEDGLFSPCPPKLGFLSNTINTVQSETGLLLTGTVHCGGRGAPCGRQLPSPDTRPSSYSCPSPSVSCVKPQVTFWAEYVRRESDQCCWVGVGGVQRRREGEQMSLEWNPLRPESCLSYARNEGRLKGEGKELAKYIFVWQWGTCPSG